MRCINQNKQSGDLNPLSDGELWERLMKIDPLKEKPYAEPEEMIDYLRVCGLYEGFDKVLLAIIVYTADWLTIFTEEIGPPLQSFFEFDIYEVQGLRLLLQNVTPGGQMACHHVDKLVALGVRHIIALGHCGALSSDIDIGDLIIYSQALRGESTSSRYQPAAPYAYPSKRLTETIEQVCSSYNNDDDITRKFASGPTYTTESMFREPAARLALCRNSRVMTVDMEAASIFALGSYRAVDVGSLSVVSNFVRFDGWQQAFKSERIRDSKRAMLHIAVESLRNHAAR